MKVGSLIYVISGNQIQHAKVVMTQRIETLENTGDVSVKESLWVKFSGCNHTTQVNPACCGDTLWELTRKLESAVQPYTEENK